MNCKSRRVMPTSDACNMNMADKTRMTYVVPATALSALLMVRHVVSPQRAHVKWAES